MNTKSQQLPSQNFRSAGFTLIEVMVTLVIFSVGLIGLAGMQWTGLQNNHSAMMRTIATIQSYDMAERIRSNRNSDYTAPPAGSIAESDITNWNAMNADKLPSGYGEIRANGAGAAGGGGGSAFTITVFWDENSNVANQSSNCPSNNNPSNLQCFQIDITP